jgi:hypothetical protein
MASGEITARTVSSVRATNAALTGSQSITLFGFSNFEDRSRTARVVGTACVASIWISFTSIRCKLGWAGSPRLLVLAPVIVTNFVEPGTRYRNSLTRAFSYNALPAEVMLLGGGTNGPSSGCTSATVAGFSFGSAGYSGRVRVGRGASSSSIDMTGGSACEGSRWRSESGVACRLSGGVGKGLFVVLSIGIQVPQYPLTRFIKIVQTRTSRMSFSWLACYDLSGTFMFGFHFQFVTHFSFFFD